MEIKPTGATPPPESFQTPESTPAGKPSTTRAGFPATTQSAEQAQPSTAAAGFTRADLDNPKTMDSMVRQTVQELVETEAGKANLSEADKQKLSDFLSSDPIAVEHFKQFLRKRK